MKSWIAYYAREIGPPVLIAMVMLLLSVAILKLCVKQPEVVLDYQPLDEYHYRMCKLYRNSDPDWWLTHCKI